MCQACRGEAWTVIIDVSRGREPALSRVQALIDAGEELGICAINLTEFFAGLRPEERPGAKDFVDRLRFWHMTGDIAIQAGIYRYAYARLGQTISTPDSLVATAIALDAIPVTNNVRHFPMPELRLLRLGR